MRFYTGAKNDFDTVIKNSCRLEQEFLSGFLPLKIKYNCLYCLLIQGPMFYHVYACFDNKKHRNCLYSYADYCQCVHDNTDLKMNKKY